jgi:N-acetylmuramoyl-L-alanine amidase
MQKENSPAAQQMGKGIHDMEGADAESMIPTSQMPPEFLLAANSFGANQRQEERNASTSAEGRETRIAAANNRRPELPNGMEFHPEFPYAIKITAHQGWSMSDVALQLYGTRTKSDQVTLLGRSQAAGPAAHRDPLPRNTWVRVQFEAMTLPWKRVVYSLLRINNRASWGAEQNREHGNGYDYQPYSNPATELHSITLHHAGNGNHPNTRSIQRMHMHEMDKADIGYHYVIDLQGNIHEGRDVNVRGSHVDGANTGAIGILWLADFVPGPLFDGNDEMTDAMLASTRRLIGHLMGRFPSVVRLGGHQEFSNSECPGPIGMRAVRSLRSEFGLHQPIKVD